MEKLNGSKRQNLLEVYSNTANAAISISAVKFQKGEFQLDYESTSGRPKETEDKNEVCRSF